MDEVPAARPSDRADGATGAPAVPIAAISALSFAAFASAASLRVTDPSLTRIGDEYGVTLAVAAYVITAYALAYGLLQVVFGPQPPGFANSYGGPEEHPSLPAVMNLAEMRRFAPRSLPAALTGYWLSDFGGGFGGHRLFSAQASFRGEGDRLLVIRSWPKTGEFITTAPANSPVTEVQQTYIEGLAALTFMPTSAVADGIGPRWMWMTDGQIIWYLDFVVGYSDNAEALALAAEVARAVQAPGAPATGSASANTGDRSAAVWLFSGVVLSGVAVASVALTRRRPSGGS
jgi:hypothetical protein